MRAPATKQIPSRRTNGSPASTALKPRQGPGGPGKPPRGPRPQDSLPGRPVGRGRRLAAGLLSFVAVAMIVTAAGVALYPFYTDWRADRQQKQLAADFDSAEHRADYRDGKVAPGAPLTRIVIPKIKVSTVVVEGTSLKALAAGAGHYLGTPLPGEPGNVAIAGHRTMNGKPFADNDKLAPGDKIILETPFARHTYEVVPEFGGHANPWVTGPADWSVVAKSEESLLTLTTCHPKGSSKQRLVVRAKLLGSEPLK